MSTGTNSNFPKARTADLITERVGDELVVYDGKSSEAHCLSALAAAVFVAADGKTSTADLAAIAGRQLQRTVDVPEVEQALAELEDRALVEPIEDGGISRRGFMQRSAAVGGAAFAATMVTSVVTPSYGSAASLFSTSFSGLGIIVLYGGVYYGMKWDTGFTNGSGPSACGLAPNIQGKVGSQPGNCYWPASSYTPQASGCLAGSYASVSGDNIVITLPSTAQIVYWAFKCGSASGTNCPSGTTVTNNTIPISC